MTVSEAIRKLERLAQDGYDDADLIFVESSSGMSYNVRIGDIIVHKPNNGDYGVLCDLPKDTLYVELHND